MNREYRTIPSKLLGQPMEMLVYGHSGKPLVVFPSQEGRFFDYENFGMIDTIAPFIQSGKIQVYCIDGIDHQTWFSQLSPEDKVRRADEYDHVVSNEVTRHIREDGHQDAGFIAHGCSFGAYHTANIALRHPKIFDSGIALSGCYNIDFTLHGYRSENTDKHNPVYHSACLSESTIEELQNNLLIVCSGQGAWEEWTGEAVEMCSNLHQAKVPALLDLWGFDVNHDWPWWKKMAVYFLEKFDRSGFLESNHRMDKTQSQSFIKSFHSI